MQEIDAIVEKVLAPLKKDGCAVQFQYAETSAKMPAVTYYILTESEALRTDNVEQSQLARVQVDVWALKRSEMSKISIKANELMQADGWLREMSRDLPRETDTQVYHRTMRFAKEIEV